MYAARLLKNVCLTFSVALGGVAVGASGCSSEAAATAVVSPATGPACTKTAECASVVCRCADGTTQNLQNCIAGKCEADDACSRLHYCGGHGGVAGAPPSPDKACSQSTHCQPEYCTCGTVQGNAAAIPVYACVAGYCLWDAACTPLPKCQ